VIVEGDLTVLGGATINGIVYVRGTTSFGAGNNTVNGSLISVGGISATDITGNTTINYVPLPIEDLDDMPGLVTTSSSPPKVVEWGEE